MKKSLLLFVLLISSVTKFVSAQEINSARFENIVKTLKLNKEKIKTEFCMEKKMPNADNYIVVLPILQGKKEIDFFIIQNIILITDQKGNIKSKYFDPVKIKSDLDAITEMTIDTGLYTIGEKIRAFGIKTRIDGPSRVAPYFSEDISLYYPSGKTLKKILDQFPVKIYDGNWNERCTGDFKFEDSVISLDLKKTNGFTDLIVKTSIISTKSKLVKNDCIDNKTKKITYKTLKFSNGTYK